MAFCHIYARRDGKFRVRMHGTVSRAEQEPFIGGTAAYTSGLFSTEDNARWWIDDGRRRDGLEDMPEPKVIRR